MPSPPPFIPKPGPLGRYVLFLLAPGAGYGASLAACHDDDFSELLIAIPPNEDGAPKIIWQILDVHAGKICGGSHADHDREHPKVEGTGRLLLFANRDDEWGAWCLVGRADVSSGTGQMLGTETSMVFEDGDLRSIVPSLASINAYQTTLAQWQTEEFAETGVEPEIPPPHEVASRGGLPEDWDQLDNAALRKLVEDEEKKWGISPPEAG